MTTMNLLFKKITNNIYYLKIIINSIYYILTNKELT